MKIRKTLSVAFAVAAFVVGTGSAWAHHAMIAQFALNKPITLHGTISKLEWKNPHGFIYVDVKNQKGAKQTWAVETGSVYNMMKRGLTQADLVAGTEVIIGGWAAKDGSRNAAGWIVTFPQRERGEDAEASFSLGR